MELVPTAAVGFSAETGHLHRPPDGSARRPDANRDPEWPPKLLALLLVTRGVTDALGRSGQEAFVTIVPVDPKAPVPVPEGSIVRLVEVQQRPIEIKDFSALVAALFPAPIPMRRHGSSG